MLKLFKNINVKHFSIMNSRETSLKLIENITVEVRNTVSISKDILFHVFEFPKKLIFNLDLKLLSELVNFRSAGKLFETISVGYGKFLWPEHVFLKGYFSFKTEDLILLDFGQRKSFLKNLKSVRTKVLINSFTNREVVFKVFHSYSDLNTKLSRHN